MALTFFLIDDDLDDRELFQFALEDVEHKINFFDAENGDQALKLLKDKMVTPDYIFLDLNMPEMSGRECLKALKDDADLAKIPIIIFSTSSDPRDIKDTKDLGAIDFIIKPPKTSELSRILNQFIFNQLQKTN